MLSKDAGNLIGLIRVDAFCPCRQATGEEQADCEDATLSQALARLAGKRGEARKDCRLGPGRRMVEWTVSRFGAPTFESTLKTRLMPPTWLIADVDRLAVELELAAAAANRQIAIAHEANG
jgi:hypothetical protein